MIYSWKLFFGQVELWVYVEKGYVVPNVAQTTVRHLEVAGEVVAEIGLYGLALRDGWLTVETLFLLPTTLSLTDL